MEISTIALFSRALTGVHIWPIDLAITRKIRSLEFNPVECLNFTYRYPVVPEGLLPRFIVRTHHLGDPATRWKSGVILRHDSGCRALVRVEAADRLVRAHVNGPEAARRELLAIIRHNFAAIHADYEFEAEELVYPRGAPDTPQRVADLEALRHSGSRTVPVVIQGTVSNPDITSLIDPVISAPSAAVPQLLPQGREASGRAPKRPEAHGAQRTDSDVA